MNKFKKIPVVIWLTVISNITYSITPEKIDSILEIVEYQYQNKIIQTGDTTKYPRSTENPLVETSDWTSSFFPGSLWYLYELTEDTFWRNNAARWTHAIENQKDTAWIHDLGFMFYCSFGNGYRLTNNENYKNIMLTAANSLALRFNETVGCMRSWDFGSWEFPVIVDNMMNLELIYWAAKEENNQPLRDKATRHAIKTIENHYRAEYSTIHLVDYDPSTGNVILKKNRQGYNNQSAWSRGQSWGLYGYATVFKETGDSIFLEHAEHIADFILNHPNLPADMIPYWDYEIPDTTGELRDVSAATIMCSALFELSQYSGNGQTYYNKAIRILENLMSEKYLATKDENDYFLLKHSIGNKNLNKEIDMPLIYADYYFLEAIVKYKKLLNETNKVATFK